MAETNESGATMEDDYSSTNRWNLIMQSSAFVDGVDDFPSFSKKSSSSSSSSSLNSPFAYDHEDENIRDSSNAVQSSSPTDLDKEHANKDMQESSTSPAAVGVHDFQEPSNNQCRATSSGSAGSSSPDSPLNDPFGEAINHDEEISRNKNFVNLTVQSSSSPDVQATSNSSNACPEMMSRKTNSENLMLQSSPTNTKISRSSSSSSSSSDDHQELDKCLPNSSNSLPKEPELPVIVQTTTTDQVKDHSSESNTTGDMSTTDSPPTQVMDRTTPPPPPTSTKYRIPSHVFARTKSNNPVDWSGASNESLFSIHTGNMSFTNDQFFLKSGELGTPGAGGVVSSTTTITTTTTASNHQLPLESSNNKATNGESHNKAAVDQTTTTKDNNQDKSIAHERQTSHLSAESAASTKSFAFPILADVDKANSVNIDASSRNGTGEQQQTGSTPKTPSSPQPLQEQEEEGQEKEKDQEEESKNPEAAQPGFRMRWLSCMPCCTFCR